MIDITAPKVIQIQIDTDEKRVWINVDGKCQLRVCEAEHIIVEDNRKPTVT